MKTKQSMTIFFESGIHGVFQSIYTTIITNIQKSLGKGSGCIIDSVIHHTISISKYIPLVSSSYIKIPKELHHTRKGLKFEILMTMNALNGQILSKRLDFKDIKFPFKFRGIRKIY